MIPTAGSGGFFFKQTRVSSAILVGDSAEKPVASIEFFIDRNLLTNGSFQLSAHIYRNYYFNYGWPWWWLYDIYFYDGQEIAMANLRVDVDEQTMESRRQFVHSTFNFSTFNFTSECSNGTHTFLSVPVTAYVMNVTGEVHLSLWAAMRNPQTGYQRASVDIDTQIDNGNNLPPVLPSTLNAKSYFFMQVAVVTISAMYSAQESV